MSSANSRVRKNAAIDALHVYALSCATVFLVWGCRGASAGSISDFLEYFQTIEVIAETNFGNTQLDRTLQLAKIRDEKRSKEAEEKISSLLRLELRGKPKQVVVSELSEGGAQCRVERSPIVCTVQKYELTRPPGRSHVDLCLRKYSYELSLLSKNSNDWSIKVKYKYDDSTCFQ